MEEKFLAQNIMIQFPRDRYNAQKLTEAFKNASIVRQNRLLNCVLTMISIGYLLICKDIFLKKYRKKSIMN